jgi:hypothetical protein
VADLVVQLLAIQDCPHLTQARQDLETVLRKGIIEVPIQLVFVSGQDDAEFLDFQGSPTIRINGDDVVPQPELPIAYGCRVYRDADGKMIGSPPIEAIQAAVDAHRRDRLQEFQRGEAAKVAHFARAIEEAEAAGASDPTDFAGAIERAEADGGADPAELAREAAPTESSGGSEGKPREG